MFFRYANWSRIYLYISLYLDSGYKLDQKYVKRKYYNCKLFELRFTAWIRLARLPLPLQSRLFYCLGQSEHSTSLLPLWLYIRFYKSLIPISFIYCTDIPMSLYCNINCYIEPQWIKTTATCPEPGPYQTLHKHPNSGIHIQFRRQSFLPRIKQKYSNFIYTQTTFRMMLCYMFTCNINIKTKILAFYCVYKCIYV